jgi:hypothetical protein
MRVYDTGCPICGEDYRQWTLTGQMAHVTVCHSLWLRLRLFLCTRTPLPDLLINRKYGVPR